MKIVCKYTLILFLTYTQWVFAERVLNPTNQEIGVKAFPNDDIRYFFNKNKAEAWRLVYAELSKPPADSDNINHCNVDEKGPDQALSFNISEIIKNVGDNFNANNLHAYYDGESGKKALALLLSELKFKKSVISIGKVLIGKGDSEYAVLTPARLKKKLTLLHDNEENKIYICFGYLQQLITTPVIENIEEYVGVTDTTINTHPAVDPSKIVFWYDGAKATPKVLPMSRNEPIKINKNSSTYPK